MTRKIAFIFSYNSYWRAILPIAEYFLDAGYTVEFYLYDLSDGDKQIQRRVGFEPKERPAYTIITDMDAFLTSERQKQYCAVFFGCGGKPLAAALARFHVACSSVPERPMAVTLYPGLCTPHHQRQYSGFAARSASDVILFNGPDDLQEYRAFCRAAGASGDNGMLFGLSALHHIRSLKRGPVNEPPENIWFIDQAILPRRRRDRIVLAQKLVDYATRHPSRRVTILLKNTDTVVSAHATSPSMNIILDALRKKGTMIPDNLRCDSGPVEKVFEDADLCLAVSSTVLFECMALDIPATAISDFGVTREIGNAYFRDSGCCLKLDDIIAGKMPEPDKNWRARHLRQIINHLPELQERINAPRVSSTRRMEHAGQIAKHADMLIKKELAKQPLHKKIGCRLHKVYRSIRNISLDAGASSKAQNTR